MPGAQAWDPDHSAAASSVRAARSGTVPCSGAMGGSDTVRDIWRSRSLRLDGDALQFIGNLCDRGLPARASQRRGSPRAQASRCGSAASATVPLRGPGARPSPRVATARPHRNLRRKVGLGKLAVTQATAPPSRGGRPMPAAEARLGRASGLPGSARTAPAWSAAGPFASDQRRLRHLLARAVNQQMGSRETAAPSFEAKADAVDELPSPTGRHFGRKNRDTAGRIERATSTTKQRIDPDIHGHRVRGGWP